MTEEMNIQDTAPQEEIGQEEKKEALKKRLEEIRKRADEANEAMREGKGIFKLETPIRSGGKDVEELEYDFMKLTGLEYTEAMDSDINASTSQIFKITYRQGLALFAKAAAKQMPTLDMRDIIERMGMTDAVECVQLATLFFTSSARAGHQRIWKKS